MTKEERKKIVKKVFIDAFWSIASIKGIAKVSVENVVKKSGYNRATFYRYFKDINQVIDEFEDNIIEQTVEIFHKVIFDKDYSEILDSFIKFDDLLYNQYNAIAFYREGVDFSFKLKNIVYQSYLDYPPFEKLDEIERNLVIEFCFGVLRNTYLYCKKEKGNIDYKKVFEIVRRYMLSGLKDFFNPS